jgi:uncharacterized protein
MRRSLFDNYTAPIIQPPRLQPNIFAKLARFSFRNAALVVVTWILLCTVILSGGLYSHKDITQEPLDFSASSNAGKNLAALNANFPNLDSMIAINISNADPEKLKLDRNRLVAAIEEKQNFFDLVFVPGTGSYYETHGILYHPADEVKTRVAYAQSLHPLFAAIAEAPTTQSLATLVNEVSASIELGRDPQGLDALFSESAKSVQALMQGTERLVDWTQVAGLNVDLQPTSALVFVLPKADVNGEALAAIEAVLKSLPRDQATTTLTDKAPHAKPAVVPAPQVHPVLGMVMAGIFLIFALVAILGDFNLSVMVMLPVLGTKAILLGCIFYFLPQHADALWPLVIAIGIISLQLSTRHSFAALEALTLGKGNESAVMLAAQKQGRGIILLSLMMMVIWAAWLTIGDPRFVTLVGIMVLCIIVSSLAALMLIPALVRLLPDSPEWRAGEWLLPLHEGFFNNGTWPALRGILTVAVVITALAGFWFAPRLLNVAPNIQPADTAVNILATSPQEAESFVKRLKTIPQAQAVRWLGAFLPQQMDEKLLAMQGLKDNFPRITPLIPQDPNVLREHIGTLQESLLAISSSPATRPELRAAADEFRRSLALLAATSGNKEVRALENRIFGSFNVLPNRADALASLEKPNLETLDPRLKALFASPENQFRLEVTPVPGQSNAALARVLAANNFPVAHPIVVSDEAVANLKNNSIMVLVAALGAGLLMLIFATTEFAGFFAALITLATMLGVIAAAAALFNVLVSPDHMLALIIIIASAFAIAATAFLKQQITDDAPPDALHATEAWLPAIFLGAISTPALFLKFDPYASQLTMFTVCIGVVTIIVAFLLRPLTLVFRGENSM